MKRILKSICSFLLAIFCLFLVLKGMPFLVDNYEIPLWIKFITLPITLSLPFLSAILFLITFVFLYEKSDSEREEYYSNQLKQLETLENRVYIHKITGEKVLPVTNVDPNGMIPSGIFMIHGKTVRVRFPDYSIREVFCGELE